MKNNYFMCDALLVLKYKVKARHQWLMPVILATQEAEIWRIIVQSQPRQIDHISRKLITISKNLKQSPNSH
jgi:hypothetical protein